jgi:hypothetical protein
MHERYVLFGTIFPKARRKRGGASASRRQSERHTLTRIHKIDEHESETVQETIIVQDEMGNIHHYASTDETPEAVRRHLENFEEKQRLSQGEKSPISGAYPLTWEDVAARGPKTQSPVYEPEDAVRQTWEALPEDLKKDLNQADVDLILDLEFKFQEMKGLVGDGPEAEGQPETIDMGEMVEFIGKETESRERPFASETIEKVLAAEETYLRKTGIL